MLGWLLESETFRAWKSRSGFLQWVYAARTLRWDMAEGRFPIYIDYPVDPRPRYGHGKPLHPKLNELLSRDGARYAAELESFVAFGEQLRTIPMTRPSDPVAPCWRNDFIGGLDAVALYCYPSLRKSATYLEIGSGNSTKFVRKAIAANSLRTRIVSIDPHPRAEIDAICDEMIRSPLEEVDLGIFERLGAGDILMVDNSHRCFQNSDVTVVFLDILPRLAPGVLVYIDDIYLPADYPPEWAARYYSEQYLLAVLLLAGSPRYEVVLPMQFVVHDERLNGLANGFWDRIGLPQARSTGNGFWMMVKQH